MRISRGIIIGLLALNAACTLYAEVLIVKWNSEGNPEPLNEQDVKQHGAKMNDIILKYEWPMCITSDLSTEEQNELFAPQPNAQEEFIERQIKKLDGSYGVLFVPTALYELFCVWQILETKNHHNPFQDAVITILKAYNADYYQKSPYEITLFDILRSGKKPHEVRHDIFAVYDRVNNLFFKHDASAFLFINNTLAQWLFAQIPGFKDEILSEKASETLKLNSKMLTDALIRELRLSSNAVLPLVGIGHEEFKYPEDLINHLNKQSLKEIIAKTIALEYEARSLNRALLIRGTSFEALSLGSQKLVLAGSSLRHKEKSADEKGTIKKEKISPYSISFGNSLFSGSLRDKTASTYSYLMGERTYSSSASQPILFKSVGYAIMIDKKEYYEHQIHNLFFIAPLASIAALFEKGDFFHSRTKAAILKKELQKIYVKGMFGEIQDPTGVILITRDPLRHAALFSEYLAKNGRIIQSGDESMLTKEEKEFAQNVLKSQARAGAIYKATGIIENYWKKHGKNFKEKKYRKEVSAVPHVNRLTLVSITRS